MRLAACASPPRVGQRARRDPESGPVVASGFGTMRPRARVLRHLPPIDAHVGIEDGQLEGVHGTMHEAGLAVAIADALRSEGVARGHARVRLLVTGGHAHAEDFDGALRLHLLAAAPDIDADIEIVHRPVERTCFGCGSRFVALSPDDPCPECGGSALPLPEPERIDIELVRPHVYDP